MTRRTYCSRTNPDEPLAGSAPHIDVWLLLEYRPAWKARASEDNDLSAETRAWLEAALSGLEAAGLRPKLQFVRQPEFDSEETRLFVGIADRLLQFSGIGYSFLADLDVVAIAKNPQNYPALSEPRYFVCTNGQRDICCSRYGLRCYAALRERVGDRAWQITHLGGHRFAPNVLVFPEALMYGRVPDTDVPVFLDTVESGGWDFSRLRGRCRFPGNVQAAEIAVGRRGLQVQSVEGSEQVAKVVLRDGSEVFEVVVRSDETPAMVSKSCGNDLEPVYPYCCEVRSGS